MKPYKKIIVFFLLFLSSTILVGQSKKEKEYLATKELIKSKKFVFDGKLLIPYNSSSIVITGDGLLVEGNKIYVNLPYVGNSFKGVMGESSTLEFLSFQEKLNIKYNDKKRKILIKFQETIKGESFTFFLTIRGNKKTEIKVLCSSRSSIVYRGKVKKMIIKRY